MHWKQQADIYNIGLLWIWPTGVPKVSIWVQWQKPNFWNWDSDLGVRWPRSRHPRRKSVFCSDMVHQARYTSDRLTSEPPWSRGLRRFASVQWGRHLQDLTEHLAIKLGSTYDRKYWTSTKIRYTAPLQTISHTRPLTINPNAPLARKEGVNGQIWQARALPSQHRACQLRTGSTWYIRCIRSLYSLVHIERHSG